MSRLSRLALLAALTCLLALSVTGLSAAPTKITVMYNANELSADEIKAFEAENPDIKVEFIQTDWNRAMAMIAAGSPPNLMRAMAMDVPYLVTHDLLQDLTKYLSKGGKYVKTSDFEKVMDGFRYDPRTKTSGKGPYWGLVKDYSMLFDVWYRKDIFRECGIPEPATDKPMTFEEFYQICKKLVKREGDRTLRYATGGMLPGLPEQFMQLCLISQGKTLYSKDFTRINLTKEPEAVKAAKYMFDLMKERLTPSPIDPADNWDVPLMIAGRQAMYQFGFWAGACFYPELKEDQLGYFPTPKWGKKWVNTAGAICGMVMFKNAPNNDAAWKFMDYFIGGGPAITRAKSGWGLPPLKSLAKYVPQETAIQKLAYKVTIDQLPNSFAMPANPYVRGAFDTAWNKYLEGALKGKYSFEEFLKKVENEVNQAIQDGMATVTIQ
ncbi:MAG: extracellular solute-binding protein [Bacillota bacterium]